jgi:hypothetical protein
LAIHAVRAWRREIKSKSKSKSKSKIMNSRQVHGPMHPENRVEATHEPGSAGIPAGVLAVGVSPATMPALPEWLAFKGIDALSVGA